VGPRASRQIKPQCRIGLCDFLKFEDRVPKSRNSCSVARSELVQKRQRGAKWQFRVGRGRAELVLMPQHALHIRLENFGVSCPLDRRAEGGTIRANGTEDCCRVPMALRTVGVNPLALGSSARWRVRLVLPPTHLGRSIGLGRSYLPVGARADAPARYPAAPAHWPAVSFFICQANFLLD
jgi:hypothetical protein